MTMAFRQVDRVTRQEHFAQIVADVETLRSKRKKTPGPLTPRFGSTPALDRNKLVGDVLIPLLLPAMRMVQDSADRAQQSLANVRVALALAWYRREHGCYPAELSALAPRYLERVPIDLFSRKSLIYRPTENGYLLYSVGINGKDEEGRGESDDPPGDDLAVRMPLPPL